MSSSTSVSPEKRYFGNQDPWKSVVAENRLGQPGKGTESFSSTDYSKLDYDRVWSSQEWKAEVKTHDRSGQPDKTSWRMFAARSSWSRGNSSRRNRAIRKVRRTTS